VWGGGGGGGGGTPLRLPYVYVPPQRVGFLRRFGLKAGIDFTYFGLNLGMVFEGMHERIYPFNFQMNKKERVVCDFFSTRNLKNLFVGILI